MASNEKDSLEKLNEPAFWMAALSIFFLAFVQLVTTSSKTFVISLLIFSIGLTILIICMLFYKWFNQSKDSTIRFSRIIFLIIGIVIFISMMSSENFYPLEQEINATFQSQGFLNGIILFLPMVGSAMILEFINKKLKKEIFFSVSYLSLYSVIYSIFREEIFTALMRASNYNLYVFLVSLGIFLGLFMYVLVSILSLLVPLAVFFYKRIEKKLNINKLRGK